MHNNYPTSNFTDWCRVIYWNVNMEKNGKDQVSNKVSNEEVVSGEWMCKTDKYWTLFGKGNIDGLAMFWDIADFCLKLLKTEWEDRKEEFNCHMIWQMMLAMLHSSRQLRTEGWRQRERMSKTCCTDDDEQHREYRMPLVQQTNSKYHTFYTCYNDEHSSDIPGSTGLM